MKSCKGVPKSHVYRIIRSGEVRVNSGRASPDCKLEIGDIVRVPPIRTSSFSEKTMCKESAVLVKKILRETEILYEDDEVLVVNKPAGIAAHGGTGNPVGIIETLRQSSNHNSGHLLELVHRLDRDTSGVLLLAKSRPSLTFLQAALQSGASSKVYLALLSGSLPMGAVSVDVPLETVRNEFGVKFSRPGVGQSCHTTFRLLKSFESYSFVEAELRTGRLHQIRAHSRSIGHPVVGDGLYGYSTGSTPASTAGLSRMFLHAHSLSFHHLLSNSTVCVKAPLPPDLQRFLDKLK
jgi:23S rRNA pseudouridine955/2504/2580 synthase